MIRQYQKLVDTCYRLREKADYQDFFLVSHEMAEETVGKSRKDYKDAGTLFRTKVEKFR